MSLQFAAAARPTWIVLLAAALAFGASPLASQTLAGRLEGRVLDPSGAAVPGAAVRAAHLATGGEYEASTNDAGRFLLPNVQLGLYTVSIEHPGFRRAVAEGVLVEVGASAAVGFELELGGISDEVTVSAGSAQLLVNLSDGEISAVIDNRRVLELPLNGRNAVELAVQQAGVFFERTPDGQGEKLFVNGMRHRGVYFSLDGVDTQDNLNRASSTMIDQPLLPMAAENVAEFKVVTGVASAEYSRGGAQITAVTRSGSNEFHGSVFEFHRNTALNANEFFSNASGVPRAPLVRNQFGGRLGGPIWQNRTFFFLGYQQTRESRSIAVNRTVYTHEARNGHFRFLDGLRTSPVNVAANPGLVRSVNLLDCGGGVSPVVSRECVDGRFASVAPPSFDPFIAGTVFAAMPVPNNFDVGDGLNTGGFRFNSVSRTAEHLPSARLDHRFSDKHFFFGSIHYVDRDIRGDFINGREPVYPELEPLGSRVTHSAGASGTFHSTLAPTFLNEFRFGYLGGENAFLINQPFGTLYTLNLNTVTNPYDPTNADEVRDNEVFHVRDSVSWVHGKHQLKGGFEWRRRTLTNYNFDAVFPQFSFDDDDFPPGFSDGDIGRLGGGRLDINDGETARDLMNNLVGAVDKIGQRFNVTSIDSGFVPGAPARAVYRNWETDFFLQDNWLVRPNITINLGLRWEWASVPNDLTGLALIPENGFESVFGVSGRNGLFRPGVLEGEPCEALGRLPVQPSAASATALISDCATRYVPYRQVNRGRLWNPDRNNFGPVVSFAWDPFKSGKTSVRGGFRISYFQDAFSILDGNLDDNEGLIVDQSCLPSNAECLNNPGGMALLRRLAPAGSAPEAPEFRLPSSRSILDAPDIDFRAYDPNLATPNYREWSFGIAREVRRNFAVEVRYVGNRGARLRRIADYNEINVDAVDPVSGRSFLDSYRIAQANLACNRASGLGARFDDASGAACITPNPLMAALMASEPARVRNRPGLISGLDFNSAGQFVYRLTQVETSSAGVGPRIRGGSFWAAVLDERLPVNFFQANPFVASSRGMIDDGFSTYHALQIDVRRRFSRGLTLNGNYVFGKALTDFDGDENALVNSTRPSPIRDPRYTTQQFMPRHQAKLNFFYELPVGKGKAWDPHHAFARAVLGGWQAGGLIDARGGRPLSILSGTGSFHRFTVSAANTVDLAQALSNAELQRFTGRLDTGGSLFWLDPCLSGASGSACSSPQAIPGLFQTPQPGRLGSLPQTPVSGPPRFYFDFNAIKRIPLRERTDIEFRWEVFNLFNNVNFAMPDTNIFSSNFGQIRRTVYNPRLMQFALKLNF